VVAFGHLSEIPLVLALGLRIVRRPAAAARIELDHTGTSNSERTPMVAREGDSSAVRSIGNGICR
jgi:hypothetical protein